MSTATCGVCGLAFEWRGIQTQVCKDCVGTATAVAGLNTVTKPADRYFEELNRLAEWRKQQEAN